MKKIYPLLSVLFLIINLNIQSKEIPIMSEKDKLKVCSGNYDNGSKEFTGTYLDGIKDGKHYEWRVGVWKFWYPNGKMKFEGLYKDGTLVSKKCWGKNGENISCDLLEMSDSERYRIFKEK
jgi:antitoxin component YwqK of YwqJK toxin-antitoxin module